MRGCSAGDPAAWRRFEQVFMPSLQAGAARVRSDREFVAEVVQELRVSLFAGPAPKALSFEGSGPLAAWLKVVATRAALDKVRGQRRSETREVRASALVGTSTTGIESRIDRERLGGQLSCALRNALATLEPRERNLLRLRYAAGLNIDAIGLAYGVHRATIARWLARAYDALGSAVRRELELGGRAQPEAELDRARRALDSRLASALASFLGAPAEESEPR